jgi:hypothetical protein
MQVFHSSSHVIGDRETEIVHFAGSDSSGESMRFLFQNRWGNIDQNIGHSRGKPTDEAAF